MCCDSTRCVEELGLDASLDVNFVEILGIDVDNGLSIIEPIEFLHSICIGGVGPIIMTPVECLWLYDLCLIFSFSFSICSIVSSFLDDFLSLLWRLPIVDCFFLANCYGLLLWMVILLIIILFLPSKFLWQYWRILVMIW